MKNNTKILKIGCSIFRTLAIYMTLNTSTSVGVLLVSGRFFEQLFYLIYTTVDKIKLRYSKPLEQIKIHALSTTYNLVLDVFLLNLFIVLTRGDLFRLHVWVVEMNWINSIQNKLKNLKLRISRGRLVWSYGYKTIFWITFWLSLILRYNTIVWYYRQFLQL